MQNLLLNINPQQESEKIIEFIRRTSAKQKINKVILGVSGGIDSTVSAYLLKQALPTANITFAHLYYGHPQFTSLSYLGFKDDRKYNLLLLSIKDMVDKVAGRLQIKDREAPVNKIRFGNIMARTRMIILYDWAKKIGGLVCGTENKSEYLLGYFTRYGDEASDFEPIRHLYKTQVYILAKYLRVPKEIIDKAPSAGLWQDQTDEAQFGFTYAEADQVLSLYFDKKYPLSEIEKLGLCQAKNIIKFARTNSFKHKTPYVI